VNQDRERDVRKSTPDTRNTHTEEAIDAVADLEREATESMSGHQRWIENVTNRLGTPMTVYVIGAFVVVWVAANLVMMQSGLKPFDPPPFAWLEGIVSLAALIIAVLILTTANRVAQIDTARAKLALQINLLNERRTGKLLKMVDDLRRDSPNLPTHEDPEVEQLAEPTNTRDVTLAIEERTPKVPGTP
jgi:uncharacterized membrane protein